MLSVGRPKRLVSELLYSGWCRKMVARDPRGRHVSPLSEDAVAWCHWGAMMAALDTDQYVAYYHVVERLLGTDTIVTHNDKQDSAAPVIALAQAAERELGWLTE